MHTITLTSEEQSTLVDILECCVSNLRSQIVHTDRYTYKQMLRDRRQIVQNILTTLENTQNSE